MKLVNKIVTGLVAIVAATSLSNASISVIWSGANDGVLYDNNGAVATENNTWIFKLIADMDGSTVVSSYTSGTLAADDVVLQTGTWYDGGGGWGQVAQSGNVADTYGLKKVYFQFFNADSSHVGYIYNTAAWVLPAAQGDDECCLI